MKFKGLGVALITPFKNDLVNYDELKRLLDFHLENKTDFLVILGTTAETPTLTYKEKKKIIKFTVKYIKKRIPIMIGTGSNNTMDTILMTKLAKKLGGDGALIVTPYYNKPPERALISHYTKIASSVDIPIMIYNVPSRTGVDLSSKAIIKLSKIRNIVGVKEASGNLSKISEISKEVNKDFAILTGNDDQILESLKLGGNGTISVTGNIIPKVIVNQIKNFNKGVDITNDFNKYLKLHNAMFIESNPIMVKEALNLMGFDVGNPRMPLVKTTSENSDKLLKILKEYGLIKND